MSDKLTYNYAEAVEATGLALTTIKTAIRDNELVAYYVTPRRPVIEASELMRWIKSKRTEKP